MTGCAAIKTGGPQPGKAAATLVTTNDHWAFPYLFADVNSWNLRIEQIDGRTGITVNPQELSPGVHRVVAYVEEGPKGLVGNVILEACRGEVGFEAEGGHEYQMNFYKVQEVPKLQVQDAVSGRTVGSAPCDPLNVWTRRESKAKF